MNKLKSTTLHLLIAFAICTGALVSSCTETELVPFDKGAANRITEFKVINATEVLYGVVDDIDNTITVSLPYYLSINFIVPEIKLEDGATLLDAEGNAIDLREDLEPVPFDSIGYKYKIKDATNAIREYTLITKIMPHKDKLKMGFTSRRIGTTGNFEVDDTTRKDAIINGRISIYGNMESSSMNAKLTLINRQTRAIVPNGAKLYSITSGAQFYSLKVDISPDANVGEYDLVFAHQGRIDTLPPLTLKHKKPYFGQLPKIVTQGETITLPVSGPNTNGEIYSGTNTGVTRAYILLKKDLLPTRPTNFPDELFAQPLELEIISQSRTEIKIKFPEVIPAGIYASNQGIGASITQGYYITQTGFGIYFDFQDPVWGKDNLLGTTPYLNFEVKAKQ